MRQKKEYGPNERTDQSSRKNATEQQRDSQPIIQFKTLVMLQELTGYFNSIEKTQAAMNVALCEIQKNLQGTNSDRKETRTQINGLEQKEEITIQPEQNEETRIQKYERLRNLWDNFKHRGARGEEEGQDIENLFEQIMKKNFPNLAKEIDFQEVQGAL